MNLKNRTYSSYFIDEIELYGDLHSAVTAFGDKIEKEYNFLMPDNSDEDLSTSVFGKLKTNVVIGEFDLSKHISGRGPTGEIIINEPTAEVPEKVFEEFLNLVNPKSHLIDDEDILRFVEKYGLLFFNPNEELINEKYHLEDLAIWKQEISLMHSLTKLYYFYDIAGYELTKSAGIKGLEALLVSKKDNMYYFDDTYKSIFDDIKNINYPIENINIFQKGNKNKTTISYEQMVVKVLVSILAPRLKKSTNNNLKEIKLQNKYHSRDYIWFNFEKDYKSLYTFLWTQFGNFIQERGKFKICEKCQKYFVSKVVQRGRFCSNNCRASKSRELEVWKLVESDFKKKGYETYMEHSDYFSKLKLSMRADAALFNKKTNLMVGLMEFKYSDVTNKSPKFKFISEKILKFLKVMKKYYKVNHAFVVNKNKKIFFWDLEKEIYGEEIKKIPDVNDLVQSEYKYGNNLNK